jgi:hypothetical protein
MGEVRFLWSLTFEGQVMPETASSFVAQRFGGRDGGGSPRGQCAGEECAEGEQRGGGEQTVCGEGAVHPVCEKLAQKRIDGESENDADGGADERDASGNPQNMRTRRAEGEADAELRRALRDAVGNDAEDADQGKDERHGGEDTEQYGEEALAAVLRVALDGLVEVEGVVGDLLIVGNGSNGCAYGVEVGERILLRADEELLDGGISVVYGR